ncbi:hypothetical protein HDU98_006880 [Podochytrium sp. JEL0797]|nr:hypothetical protein HDU98_006880 [Podochytrium sp. JEL0797]
MVPSPERVGWSPWTPSAPTAPPLRSTTTLLIYNRFAKGPPSIATKNSVHDSQTSDEMCLSATDSAVGDDAEGGNGVDYSLLLPYEVSVQILSNISTLDSLLIGSLLNKRWHNASNDNQVWREMFQRRFGKSAFQKVARNLNFPVQLTPKRILESTASACVPTTPDPPVTNHNPKLIPRPPAGVSRSTEDALSWKHVFHQRLILHNNWSKGNYTVRSFTGHTDAVYCIQFKNNLLASGSRDRTLKFWDMDKIHCLRSLSGHNGSILCMQHDDKHIVTGSSDATAIVWDFATGTPLFRLAGHALPVLDIRFGNGKIVTCSKDCTIKVWDLATGHLLHTMEGHQAAVNAVEMNGDFVVSASGDCVIKMWNLHTGSLVRTFKGHTRGLACLQFDGTTILSGSNDFTIKIWNASTGACMRTLEGHSNLVRTLCFDEDRIVSGSYDNTIKVWDRRTGECLHTLGGVHNSWVFHVQMDATRIVSSAQDKKIAIWEFGGGCQLLKLFS